MKRPPPTFVVEVRRQRRSTNSSGKAWLAEPPLAGAAAGPERHPGAAALFEAEPKASLAAETPPPSRPQGRILPSLADIAPIASPLEEAPARPRRKREGLALPSKAKTRTKKGAGREFAPPSRQSFEEPAVAWPAPGGTAAEAAPKVKAPSRPAKSKRKVVAARPLPARAVAVAVAVAEPAALPEASVDNATADRAGARQARHRRILDRYVLGAELKPGERWKRRLQKARK